MYKFKEKEKFSVENRLKIKRELLEMLFIIDKEMDNMDRKVVTLKIRIKELVNSLRELDGELTVKEKTEFNNFKTKFVKRLLEFRKSFTKYETIEITPIELDLWLKKQAKMEAVYNQQKAN